MKLKILAMFVSGLYCGFQLLQYWEFKMNYLQLNVLTSKYVCLLNLDVAENILLGWSSHEVSCSELPSKEPSAGSIVGCQPSAATLFDKSRWSTVATVTLCSTNSMTKLSPNGEFKWNCHKSIVDKWFLNIN